VIESTNHYFITYAFFIRGTIQLVRWSFAPDEHENDMEGCTLAIEKGRGVWGSRFCWNLAHDHFYKMTILDQKSVKDPSRWMVDRFPEARRITQRGRLFSSKPRVMAPGLLKTKHDSPGDFAGISIILLEEARSYRGKPRQGCQL